MQGPDRCVQRDPNTKRIQSIILNSGRTIAFTYVEDKVSSILLGARLITYSYDGGMLASAESDGNW